MRSIMKECLLLLCLIILISGCSSREYTSAITVEQKDGLINNKGEVLVKPIYKKIFHLENLTSNKKFVIVKNIDNKYGIIDTDGTLKLKVIFDSIGNFFNGFAKIEVNGKFGLINEDFEIVLKPIYDGVRDVIDKSVIVKNFNKNKKIQYGCLNSTNMEIILPLDYDMIYLSSEDRMRTYKDGLWGFIDAKCNIISENKYQYVDDFSNAVARVKKDNLWTHINLDGKELNKRTFSNSDNF